MQPEPEPEPEAEEMEVDEEERAARKRKAEAQKEKEAGNAAYKARQFQDAVGHYNKAIELDATDISFLTNRCAACRSVLLRKIHAVTVPLHEAECAIVPAQSCACLSRGFF